MSTKLMMELNSEKNRVMEVIGIFENNLLGEDASVDGTSSRYETMGPDSDMDSVAESVGELPGLREIPEPFSGF
jgi:hypothetical protein